LPWCGECLRYVYDFTTPNLQGFLWWKNIKAANWINLGPTATYLKFIPEQTAEELQAG